MEFDKTKYEIRTWKSFSMLHWILNPGIILGELIFGLRIPKVILIDRDNEKPFAERYFIPCPHCGKINNGRIWTSLNKTLFKNWFGYYCPECGGVIPCLRNLISLLFIILTFPFWIWFLKRRKSKWLKKQAVRFKNIKTDIPEKYFWTNDNLWIWTGLLIYFIQNIVTLFEYLSIEKARSLNFILEKSIIWLLIFASCYGYLMIIWKRKKKSSFK
ncbi:MAG: hypothetical protein Q8880_00100 [Bacteroidota bacterium]|nr:hypothetical protein [Bacteroidota bacterium]